MISSGDVADMAFLSGRLFFLLSLVYKAKRTYLISVDQFLFVAGTTLTHQEPFGNAMPRQLDQVLKELIAHYRSSTIRYDSFVH